MNHIAVFARDSEERRRLDVVSQILNLFSGLETSVQETYFDYGQGWKWTTVVGRRKDDDRDAPFQVLDSARQKLVLPGSMAELNSVVQDHVIKYPRD